MARSQHDKYLARSPRAFETDTSWYQSYWFDPPQAEPAKPSVHIAVWVAVLAVGVFISL